MNLGNPPAKYDPRDQAALRDEIRRADLGNQKRNTDYRLDAGVRLVIADDDTGDLYRIKIASGVLSVEAFTG